MEQEYYAVDLPGAILYDKKFSVSIRRITPIEQKFILTLSQKQQRTNRDYINFLKKLVKFDNPEMQFEDLFWFDVQYLLYRIRFTTYEKYPIKLRFYCNEEDEEGNVCTQEITHELKIGDLNIATPDDIEDLTTGIHLDNLGDVAIRQKTMRDDITIDDFARKNNIDANDTEMRLLLLDLCLISKGHTLEELYQMAYDGTITANDIVTIEKWFTKVIWGVKEEVTIKCPKCGKESSRAYVLALEDFFSVA